MAPDGTPGAIGVAVAGDVIEASAKPAARAAAACATTCRVCFLRTRGGAADALVSCARCGRAFHPQCLRPALPDVPPGDWACDGCVRRGRGVRAARAERVARLGAAGRAVGTLCVPPRVLLKALPRRPAGGVLRGERERRVWEALDTVPRERRLAEPRLPAKLAGKRRWRDRTRGAAEMVALQCDRREANWLAEMRLDGVQGLAELGIGRAGVSKYE